MIKVSLQPSSSNKLIQPKSDLFLCEVNSLSTSNKSRILKQSSQQQSINLSKSTALKGPVFNDDGPSTVNYLFDNPDVFLRAANQALSELEKSAIAAERIGLATDIHVSCDLWQRKHIGLVKSIDPIRGSVRISFHQNLFQPLHNDVCMTIYVPYGKDFLALTAYVTDVYALDSSMPRLQVQIECLDAQVI